MSSAEQLPRFDRSFRISESEITRIGGGEIGGKAAGLLTARNDVLSHVDDDEFADLRLGVPTFTVLATDIFDDFMERNGLYDVAMSDEPDDRIAMAFQDAELSPEFVGDLRALVSSVHTPLAVRSSSRLEDALAHPFAGVYGTKMIPNNQPGTDARFHRLMEAIKFVYASTFFSEPKSYVGSTGASLADEKMAVIVQEVVGHRMNDRFYPAISGVARSYSYYPTGAARPEDGVVNLALGLGKQIVDGGLSWTYCPRYPKAPPPYAGVGDLMKNTQTGFWSVNMGPAPPHDPVRETEYLEHFDLAAAEYDGTLAHIASTYDSRSERLRPGMHGKGPRVLDFAPLLSLRTLPLNDLMLRLLPLAEEAVGREVEVEFAVALDPLGRDEPRFGFLQARPMMVSRDTVDVTEEDLSRPNVIVASEHSMGNGIRTDVTDIVYVRPDTFEARQTPKIRGEIKEINRKLVAEGRPYLLIGFGRWGSSDPWLGIAVDWAEINGAVAIVEATLPQMTPDLSQGSHFFHNLISFEVFYLSVKHTSERGVRWDWLDACEAESESPLVRHVRLERPLEVRVDGRTGRGAILHAY